MFRIVRWLIPNICAKERVKVGVTGGDAIDAKLMPQPVCCDDGTDLFETIEQARFVLFLTFYHEQVSLSFFEVLQLRFG